jgi:hypothetical protein
MTSRFNIPAPPTFKPGYARAETVQVLIILVPQGDVRAQARADLLTFLPRKVPVYTKVPVPETDTGGWVEYTKARE